MKQCKYFFVLIVAFFLLPGIQASAQSPADTLQSNSEEKAKNKSFRFGVHLAGAVNQLDYGSPGPWKLKPAYGFGGNFGFSFDWKVSKHFNIRFEPFYGYQEVKEEFEDLINTSSVSFKSHVAGINFFPLVLSAGKGFQPQLSVGGQVAYTFASNTSGTLNGNELKSDIMTPNTLQYGPVLGIGAYINRTLIEVRVQHTLVNFIEELNTRNSLNQVKLVFNL